MAERAGVFVARLHYYETEGLIESWRTSANHRRYDRRELRRVAITRIAQSVGVPLAESEVVLGRLLRGKAVSAKTWARAAAPCQAMLDERNRINDAPEGSDGLLHRLWVLVAGQLSAL